MMSCYARIIGLTYAAIETIRAGVADTLEESINSLRVNNGSLLWLLDWRSTLGFC